MANVVGLFHKREDAEAAADELMGAGFSSDDINMVARDGEGGAQQTTATGEDVGKGAGVGALAGGAIGGVAGLLVAGAIPGIGPILAAGPIAAALGGAGIGAVAGGLIGALGEWGVPEEEAQQYAEGVRRGGTLVSARTDDERMAQRAADIMNGHDVVDIDRAAQAWRAEGWTGFKEGEEVFPVAEEELKVGKREAGRGRVRVYSDVKEKPVQQDVSLHEEHARIETRDADRPLHAGEEPFKEKSIEVTETAEEPVVEKSARVTGEVAVGKDASEHRETVRDTVRGTEVKVERRQARSTPYTGPERRHQAPPGL